MISFEVTIYFGKVQGSIDQLFNTVAWVMQQLTQVSYWKSAIMLKACVLFLSASNGFGFSINNIYFIFFWLANSNYGKKDSTNDKYSSVKFVWEMSGKLLLLYVCLLTFFYFKHVTRKINSTIFSLLFTVKISLNFLNIFLYPGKWN